MRARRSADASVWGWSGRHPAAARAMLTTRTRNGIRRSCVAYKSFAKSTGIDSSSRTRTGHHLRARVFQCGYGLLAPHGRKLAQKLLKAVASFEVIEERLNRDARADEHRRSTEPVWVAMHHVLWESQRTRHRPQSTPVPIGVHNAIGVQLPS